MKDHKLIKTLVKFSRTDCKKFEQFLKSPYHNTSDKVHLLGIFLLSFYPAFDSSELTEEAAFESIFPGQQFNKHELNRYFSKLFSVLEQFVVAELFNDDPFISRSLIELYYYQTNNIQQFEKAQKNSAKILGKLPYIESKNYFYKYLNQKLTYNALIQEANTKGVQDIYLEATTSLNSYFLIEMFQASTLLKIQHRIGNLDTIFPFLESALVYAEENLQSLPLLVKLWYFAFKLITSPDDEKNYNALKSTLKLNLRSIPAIDARNFAVILNNSLLRQAHKGRSFYLKERFDTYLIEIQEGWLIADNLISYHTFNNIILNALTLDHIDWAEQFLQEHLQYLHEEVAESIIEYNRARISFFKGDYQDCQKRCATIPFLDTNITLGIKQIQIKCFFELSHYEQLFSALHALTMYVSRLPDKADKVKQANLNFIKLVKNLYQIHESPDSDHDELETQFNEQLKKTPLLPQAEWLQHHFESSRTKKS